MTDPQTPPKAVALLAPDATLRDALAFLLRSQGYAVEICDGAHALAQGPMADGLACLVIDDDDRLEPRALSIVAELRRRGVETAAILLTARTTPQHWQDAARCRASIIEKPLLGTEILQALRDLI